MAKEVLYIDIDDDISGIINKLEESSDKVVALVLPKHATTFLSTVNMKLLKKAADASKKSLVLITSDPSILPLASSAGLHTAKSLSSKPVLAKVAKEKLVSNNVSSEDLDDIAEVPTVKPTNANDDVIEIDNTQKFTKVVTLGKKNHKLKVPNFNSFRLRVFLGAFAILLLIAGWFVGFVIMPKATITLKTDVSNVDSSIQFTANAALKEFDAKTPILPATVAESKQKDSEKVPATGKKDIGTKAQGNVSLKNCTATDGAVLIPAGTTVFAQGYNFLTGADVTLPASSFTGGSNTCITAVKTVTVIAEKAGGEYNLSPTTYKVANFASVVATGEAMGGGTSKLITVISAADIDSAKQKLTGKSKALAITDLTTNLETQSLLALGDTLSETAPVFTVSAAVDTEASDVTVNSVTAYSMLGVSTDNVKSLVEADVTTKITDSQQKILDNGLGAKKLVLIDKKSPSEQKLSITVVAIVGPDIVTSGISAETVGKTTGDIQKLLTARAGVKEVTVHYEPFWVTSTPKNASKIRVIVEQVNAK